MSQTSDTLITLSPQQRYRLLALVNAATMLIIVVTFMVTGIDVPGREDCVKRFVDFHAIWGAAQLALEMNPIAAFERENLEQAYAACDQVNMYWLYPAPMAVALTPIGALPFLMAFVSFQLLSLGLLALSVRRYLPNDTTALIAIVFAPAWLPALMVGQFTILWCVGLLVAISAMRDDRHVLAGILIGCLTLKPTLGLLIPVVLFADRRYATIIAATVTTIILHVGATALYGFEYLPKWVETSRNHGVSLATYFAETDTMASVGAFLALLGLPPEIAIYANMGLFAIAGVILFFVWRQYGARSDAACAVLFAAIPLSTPYLWHYDAAFCALAAMFIYRAGRHGWHVLHWALLAIVWAGPGLTLWNTYFFKFAWIYPTIAVPPVLLLCFGLSLLQLKMQSAPPSRQQADIAR